MLFESQGSEETEERKGEKPFFSKTSSPFLGTIRLLSEGEHLMRASLRTRISLHVIPAILYFAAIFNDI